VKLKIAFYNSFTNIPKMVKIGYVILEKKKIHTEPKSGPNLFCKLVNTLLPKQSPLNDSCQQVKYFAGTILKISHLKESSRRDQTQMHF
jgi:hypothetical protein